MKNTTLLVEDLLQKEGKRDPSNDRRVELTEINHQAGYPWSKREENHIAADPWANSFKRKTKGVQ